MGINLEFCLHTTWQVLSATQMEYKFQEDKNEKLVVNQDKYCPPSQAFTPLQAFNNHFFFFLRKTITGLGRWLSQ